MIRTYEGTKAVEEIIYSEGVLFIVVRPEGVESDLHRGKYESLAAVRGHRGGWFWRPRPRAIVAVNAASGAALWRKSTPAAQAKWLT